MENYSIILNDYKKFDDILINYEILINNFGIKKDNIFVCLNSSKTDAPKYYNLDTIYFNKDFKEYGYKIGGIYSIVKSMGVLKDKIKTKYVVFLVGDSYLKTQNIIPNIIKNLEEDSSQMFILKVVKRTKNKVFDVYLPNFIIIDYSYCLNKKIFEIDVNKNTITVPTLTKICNEKLNNRFLCEDIDKSFFNKKANKLYQRDYKDCLVFHSHVPQFKKEFLVENNIIKGQNIQKLLNSKDLSYFNGGVERQSFLNPKDQKVIP